MRKAISVSALILALTCSAYAGDMPNGAPEPPPPPPPPMTSTLQAPTTDGDMPNGVLSSIVEVVLNLLTLP
jgi:hypothetical protein